MSMQGAAVVAIVAMFGLSLISEASHVVSAHPPAALMEIVE